MAGKPSFPDEHLLLGKHMGKDVFCPLPELEALVDMQEQRWYECLRLLATRFPDGFEGQATWRHHIVFGALKLSFFPEDQAAGLASVMLHSIILNALRSTESFIRRMLQASMLSQVLSVAFRQCSGDSVRLSTTLPASL
jgi:hypothetical protein